MSNSRRDSLSLRAAYVAALGLAVVVGLVVATIDWRLSVVVVVAGIAVLGLALLRAVVHPLRPAGDTIEQSSSEDPRFRSARLAYYLGAATIGLLTVRLSLGFTASDWIFLASLAIVCAVIIVHRLEPHYLVPGVITTGVVIFALGGLLASTQALYPYASAFVVIRMLYLTLVWFWLGTIVLETRAHVQNAVLAWVCSAALSSSGALIQLVYGDVIPGGTLAWGRMTGFTDHFTILGGLAATAFVPALMFALDGSRARIRLIGFGATALLVAGLTLSGSVGGFLAAAVGTAVWLTLRGVGLRIVVGGVVVFVCGLLLLSGSASTDTTSPLERIEAATSKEQAALGTGGTIYARLEGFSRAWDRITEQPFIGVGLDIDTNYTLLGGFTVHNVLLGPWFSAGLLGLVGVAMLLLGSISLAVRVLRQTPEQDWSFVAALVAALAAFIQHGMGEPILFVRYGWFPTALLIALNAQHLRAVVRSSASYRLGRPQVSASL